MYKNFFVYSEKRNDHEYIIQLGKLRPRYQMYIYVLDQPKEAARYRNIW